MFFLYNEGLGFGNQLKALYNVIVSFFFCGRVHLPLQLALNEVRQTQEFFEFLESWEHTSDMANTHCRKCSNRFGILQCDCVNWERDEYMHSLDNS